MPMGFNVLDTGGSINSIWNGSWNDLATEKTAKDISTAIDKASQKITADGNKNSQKAIEVFKAGADKITDAIGKIKPTNNAEQTVAPTSAAETVADGLTSIGKSAIQLADHLRSAPSTKLDAVAHRCWAIGEQFTDFFAAVSLFDKSSKELRETTEEVAKATTESGSSLPNDGGGGRIQTIPVGNTAFSALWGQYGN